MSMIAVHPRSAVPAAPPFALLVLLLVAVSPLLVPHPRVLVPAMPAPMTPYAPVVQPDWAKVPLSFVPNLGLTDPSVAFQTRGMGGTIFFTPQEVMLALPVPALGVPRPTIAAHDAVLAAGERISEAVGASAQVVRLQFDGANPQAVVRGGERQPGVVNSFIGNDPATWRTNVPTYAGIVYENLYPGISLRYDGRQGALKGTYTVAPGADPSVIRWRYDGARGHPRWDDRRPADRAGDGCADGARPGCLAGEGRRAGAGAGGVPGCKRRQCKLRAWRL